MISSINIYQNPNITYHMNCIKLRIKSCSFPQNSFFNKTSWCSLDSFGYEPFKFFIDLITEANNILPIFLSIQGVGGFVWLKRKSKGVNDGLKKNNLKTSFWFEVVGK